jgi:hypothetical protein
VSSYTTFDYLSILTSCSASQTGRAHLLLISRTPGKAGGAMGVVTLEGTIKPLLALVTWQADFEVDIIEVTSSFPPVEPRLYLMLILIRKSSLKRSLMKRIDMKTTKVKSGPGE